MKANHHLAFLSILFFLFIAHKGLAQEEIDVRQVKETISSGEHTGFEVIIPQASIETVKKAWIKQLQQGVKPKVLETGGEISISGALIKEVGPGPINIYSNLKAVDSNVRLVAIFEIDSIFYDPDSFEDKHTGKKTHEAVENYLRSFAVDQYELAVEEELKAEEQTLKDLSKELESLEKEENKMESSIKDEENKISQAEEEIRILKAERERQTLMVEEKRVASATLIDKDAQKVAKDEIKAYEKERDKTDKEISKQEKAISNSENKIEEYEKAIQDGKEQQEALQGQIEKQEEVVQQVEEKLKGIK